jgi:peptidyl-prolyl cis-trans isomerase SurA
MITNVFKFILICQCWCLFGILLCVTLVVKTAPAAQVETVDRIVAVVNEEIITLYDLNRIFEPYAKNVKALNYSKDKERQMLFKVRSDLLKELVDRKLADQEIKRNKLVVTEEEIDKTIEQLKTSRSFTDEELRAGLAEQGLTIEDYRKQVKEQLLRSRLINIEVKSKIVITDENIQAYYDSHREKYVGEQKYHLWNIYIALSQYASDSDKRAARKKMESILEKLNGGGAFQDLTQDDFIASLGAKGGDLGLFLIKELSPQLQKVVENMKAGEFSAIIDMNNVYQILYVEKIIEATSKSVEEVRGEIEDILFKELINDKYQEWLNELRRRSHIKIIQ